MFSFKIAVYLLFFSISLYVLSEVNANSDANCSDIISRKKWASRSPKNIAYQILPVRYVIVHHTVTASCNSKSKCSNILLTIQNYNMNEQGGDDIPYNFLIGDNDIYEGTGWHVRGSHTKNYNSNSTGIAFIGTFNDQVPSTTAIQKAKQLLECGVKLGELHKDYKLLGGRQIYATESPGLELYVELQEWDHWSETP